MKIRWEIYRDIDSTDCHKMYHDATRKSKIILVKLAFTSLLETIYNLRFNKILFIIFYTVYFDTRMWYIL